MPNKVKIRHKALLLWLQSLLVTGSGTAPAGTAEDDSWATRADLANPRVFHGTCTAAGKLYVFGGQSLGGGEGMDSVEEYDPGLDSWRDRASMPTGRLGMMVSGVGGKCYVMGGVRAPGNAALTRVDEYDPKTDRWRRRSDMPTARVAGTSAVIGDTVYVAGGWTHGSTASQVVAAMEAYDPASDGWASKSDMPTARALASAASAAGKVYVIGGGSAAMGTLNSATVEAYDPTTDSWNRRSDLPTPRGTLTTGSVDGRIFAIGGGFTTGHLDTVEAYDTSTDRWALRSPMPTARWGVSGGVLNGKIYVLGGSTELGVGHNSLAVNEVYRPVGFQINAGLTDAWFNAATPGQGFLIVVFPEQGIVFLAWFTYDTERPPDTYEALLGEIAHRWVTAQGPFEDDAAILTVYLTQGGVFDAADPPAVTDTDNPIGTITIVWHDCSSATLTYDIGPPGVMGEIPLRRIVPDNEALCEALTNP